MRFVSLFSGIGGIDLGLERAGMECVAQVENDPWCNQILEKHWPNTPRWQDIHDLDPKELPDHDLIAGGFPCQPVSLAGARLAQDDPRWLWPEFFRIVRVVRPRYVLVENVPGLASAGMGDVLGDLASCGYDTEWQSLPAAFVGAPHLRWRVFIVAHPAKLLGYGSANVYGGEHHKSAREPRGSGVRSRTMGHTCQPSADAYASTSRPRSATGESGWWSIEPDVGRVADGVPQRVDRLRGLGNAVVPQVAELVGWMIMASV